MSAWNVDTNNLVLVEVSLISFENAGDWFAPSYDDEAELSALEEIVFALE